MLRDATEDDLRDIVEIFNVAVASRNSTAVLEPVTIEERRPWLEEHSPDHYPLWVLEVEKRVAGWLSFQAFMPRSAYRGTAEISVYVHNDFHRHGVARRLLEEAIERSSDLGISALVGLILGHNKASLALFESLGFARWGLLPRVTRLDGKERDIVIVGKNF
ncbi:MAG: N-acetyltransferase family protein [Chthoniobacterales bacterium]